MSFNVVTPATRRHKKARTGLFRVNEHLFRSYRHAREIIEVWRHDYNTERPHTSLDGLTPKEFATRSNQDQNMNRANL